MSQSPSATETQPPLGAWRWWICGLLLCASTINYIDRVTLSAIATRISGQFHLTQAHYGTIETGFGWAFATGSLLFGLVVDRFPVRWVYPFALLMWSVAGFLTGYARNYEELLACRVALGLFEGGHWPCAIKTTRWLLQPQHRSFGNSVLQSGTSIGAILAPIIMKIMLTPEPDSWRAAFKVIGAIGLLWIVAWFALVRSNGVGSNEVAEPAGTSSSASAPPGESLWDSIFSRRMLVIVLVIALINTWWQLLRAWLPKVLQEGRGYAESDVLTFLPFFYIATDVGVIASGMLTLWFFKRGASVHASRVRTFGVCTFFSALAVVAAFTPRGPLLLVLLMLMGAGTLGLFPIYHALTQDFPSRHQGTMSGLGGVAAWALSFLQREYGKLVDRTHSFDLGFALAGAMPFFAFLILWTLWPRSEESAPTTTPALRS